MHVVVESLRTHPFLLIQIFFCLQEFVVAQSMDTDNIEQIQEFMDESIKGL